jgi:hypothetical protein
MGLPIGTGEPSVSHIAFSARQRRIVQISSTYRRPSCGRGAQDSSWWHIVWTAPCIGTYNTVQIACIKQYKLQEWACSQRPWTFV